MKLALGTVQFGLPYGIANNSGQVTRDKAAQILTLARHSGIEALDTAIAYGDSETYLGDLGIDGFRIVTKLPALPEDCVDVAGWVRWQVQASLKRLGQTSVHGLLLHRALDLVGLQGRRLARALQALKSEGLVRKIDVSVYAPAELDAVVAACPLELVQAPLNLVDRRLVTSGWLERLHAQGAEVHIRSAFLQGLLLMPQEAIPHKFRSWNELWRRWHAWLADSDVSAIQACLAYPLSFEEVDHVVVGVDTAAQLDQLIKAHARASMINLPDLACDDDRLINPSYWNLLDTHI